MKEVKKGYFPYHDPKRGEALNEFDKRLREFADEIGVCYSMGYDGFSKPGIARVNFKGIPMYYSIMLDCYPDNVDRVMNSIKVDVYRRLYSKQKANTLVTTGKLEIRKVIFNNGATIVLWADGDKTVVKCQDGEPFDPEKGLAMAISKRTFGNSGRYYEEFKKWLPVDVKESNEQVSDIVKETKPETVKNCCTCKYYNEPACSERCRLCGYYTNWEPAE